MWSLRRQKKREPGGFCPVCRQQELVFAAARLWKCRSCGSRIPDPAYLEFLLSALDPRASRRDRMRAQLRIVGGGARA